MSLCACGTLAAPESPTPPATAATSSAPPTIPEYSLIDSDTYAQDGEEGVGYRVEIGDDATEEDMRAIFSGLTAADSYTLYTV